MKSQVYDIEAQMAVLSQKTLEITDAASKINQALDGNRNKMNQLSNAHAIISKVCSFLETVFLNLNLCLIQTSSCFIVKFYFRASGQTSTKCQAKAIHPSRFVLL